MKVYVGMSGGVDSSVSATLLLREGHEVTGVFIRGWSPEGFPCSEEDDRRDAMRVAAHLGIPFKTLDAKEAYKKRVADRMLDGYRHGLVPNPDVLCNQEIKFGIFYDWALQNGADAVATGHYAQIIVENRTENEFLKGRLPTGKAGGNTHSPQKLFSARSLARGVDEAKDQSYFLYTLKADQLPHIIFPIGSYKKREVRALARSFNLPVAEKPDSQGLCFIGKVDMAEFLVRELGIRKGEVLNEKGEVIGMHDGAHLYTLGARHGFTVQEKTDTRHAYYIVSKDIEKNTITVAPKDSLKEHAPHSLELAQVTWIGESHAGAVDVQYRYHGPVVKAEIHNNHLRFMDIPKEPVAPGQSIVFYEGEICLGGGVAI